MSFDIAACSDAFQFTRPRGARLVWFAVGDFFKGFNSRAHAGRDLYNIPGIIGDVMSFNSRAHAGRDIVSCVML
mgnify:CR=1 FL=1